eukprot:3418954-Amphidinium_carterae.2
MGDLSETPSQQAAGDLQANEWQLLMIAHYPHGLKRSTPASGAGRSHLRCRRHLAPTSSS